ncbi:hypothetical protein [Legionella sp. W05-934-2]|uniref:hypothetical protein n=1 Tax=Legionella sp. W05-934-2 TaxID=1198649 RepID=UPI003462AA27
MFVAYDCNQYGADTIKYIANKYDINFDIQESITSEDVKVNQIDEFLYRSYLDKILCYVNRISYGYNTNMIKHQVLAFCKSFQGYLKAAEKLISDYQPSAILFGEDGLSGNCYLIKKAKEHNIPTLTIPYEISGKEDLINAINEKYLNNEALLFNKRESRFHKIIAQNHSKWITNTSHGQATLFPVSYIAARLINSLDLPDPWTTHGGSSDLLISESKIMTQHYISENIIPDKIYEAGSVYCDVLYEALNTNPIYQNAYTNKCKLKSNKTSILVSIPPSYHETRVGENEFSTYSEMITNIFNLIKVLNCETSVSIHPAVSEEQTNMIREAGFKITDKWLIEEIPAHDIYFTISFSSTIRWGIASGKPVINYDAYNHNLKIYDHTQGFYSFNELKKIGNCLQALMPDSQYSAVSHEIGKIRREWGVLDGKNTERINAIILSSITKRLPLPK